MLRIVVLGYIVRGPIGGLAWHHLQYVAGLTALGHDVWFLEDSDDYPSCYDPVRLTTGHDPAFGLAFASDAFERIGHRDRWAYYDAHTRTWLGPAAATILEVCATADLIINLSGINPLRPWIEGVPARAFVDTDPAFTQVRHLTDPEARSLAARHTAFFTFGEQYGRAGCLIPDDGFPWIPTRQPIVLDLWRVIQADSSARWTTIMQWDSYDTLEWKGLRLGMKSESFAAYADLPARAGPVFTLAAGSPTVPVDRLKAQGWDVINPLAAIADPWAYQRFIQQSKGEWSVAKQGYVVTRSGWFSERSAAYLASGRPVVAQDTGFSSHLPTGEGLFAFSSPDEVLEAIEQVSSRYDAHCRAAREMAAEYFDARVVLASLIERALAPSPVSPSRLQAPPDAV